MKQFVFIIAVVFVQMSCKNTGTSNNVDLQEDSLNIVTSDVQNFWIAYDKLSSSADSVQIIQQYYLDKASPEFKEFLKLRNSRQKNMWNQLKKFQAFGSQYDH